VRVLITGGLGFIGSHLVMAAAAAGHEVRVLDSLTYAGRTDNLPRGHRGVFKCDVTDDVLVGHHLRDFKPDWIAHLAAESHVGRSLQDAEAFLRTNVVGTHVMLEAACKYWWDERGSGPFKFLLASTDEVYGSLGEHEAPWTEQSPLRPNNQYSASKAAAEHLCRAYWMTRAFPVVVTRGSNTFGPCQHPEKLIPTLARQVLANESMTLHGDGLHRRDWIHVGDHCCGILAALRNGQVGSVYNLGGGEEMSNTQVATLVAKQLSNGIFNAYKLVPDRDGNDRRYAMNVSKALTELDWFPSIDQGKLLVETLNWYRDNQGYEATYGR
jgi:dTDP-glucose 4,6-dehydratase